MASRRLLPRNETVFTGAIVASALVLALRGWLLFRSGDNILAYAADPIASAPGILGEQLALSVLRLLAVILDVAAGLAILSWTGRLQHEGLLSRRERRLAILVGLLPWTPLLLAQSIAAPPVALLVFAGHIVWVALVALILRRARAAQLLVDGTFARASALAALTLGAWVFGGAAAPWVYAQPSLGITEALNANVQAQLLQIVTAQRVRGAIMIAGGAFTLVAVLPLMSSVRSATALLDKRLEQLREES
ncbi:MAG: hypothetical protein WCP88_00045 [bacterium]